MSIFVKVVGLHTLLAKAVGIVFSVSAGLPCGKAWDRGKNGNDLLEHL